MLSGRARRIATSTAATVTVVSVLSFAPGAAAERRPNPGGRTGAPLSGSAALATVFSSRTARYRAQALSWRGCIDKDLDPSLPTAYYRLQCATLTAPLDWENPGDGRQISIAVSRLPASVSPAKGVLFTNPGGPGGPGVELPLLFLSAGRRQLTRTQDIYGIDVRGTGGSSNVTCGGAPSMLLDPRDRSKPNLDLLLDAAQLAARACDVAGGDLIDHVNTDQTVRDLDLLRTVVAAPKINWLGYSAGTWLGAQYATVYPGNVGHMVLDSNLDFTGSWQDAMELEPSGFERRFREDFAPWAAKYQSRYRLGASASAVQASYERIRAELRPDVPIDSAVALDQLIAGSLYAKGLFPLAAQVLTDVEAFLTAQRTTNLRVMSAAGARVSAAVPLLQRFALSRQPFASDASDAAFLAVTCNDTPWSGDRAGLVATSQRLGEQSPLIGWATVSQPCAFWDRPALTTPVPTGAGVPPVLMVQSEHDPATPIEGARRAAGRFAGARMLTVTNEGDHGLYAGGNPCVDKTVESFIVTGALPAEGATCPGQPLPDPVSAQSLGTAAANGRSAAALPAPGTNPLVALRMLSAATH